MLACCCCLFAADAIIKCNSIVIISLQFWLFFLFLFLFFFSVLDGNFGGSEFLFLDFEMQFWRFCVCLWFLILIRRLSHIISFPWCKKEIKKRYNHQEKCVITKLPMIEHNCPDYFHYYTHTYTHIYTYIYIKIHSNN